MIFVDTSFWVGLAIEPDANHELAEELLSRYGQSPLATTNLVCGETWTFVRRRHGHRLAQALIDAIERTPRLQILTITAEAERDAWEWLRQRDEREHSYVDATSFAIMRRRAVHEVLTFDADFAAAGFVQLLI
ncbi:MAG TPA: PIN domain-containing protein [Gaiellaceae bacterium]|jgi:predicted nucleic acid-binding protein|nr:PIN domain-containing protein [Gaiellaceae bacterium]